MPDLSDLLSAAAEAMQEAAGAMPAGDDRQTFHYALFGANNPYGDRIDDRAPKALRALMREKAGRDLIRQALPKWKAFNKEWEKSQSQAEPCWPLPFNLRDADTREAPIPSQAAVLLYLAAARLHLAAARLKRKSTGTMSAPFDWPGVCWKKGWESSTKDKPVEFDGLSDGFTLMSRFDAAWKNRPQDLAEALAAAFEWAARAMGDNSEGNAQAGERMESSKLPASRRRSGVDAINTDQGQKRRREKPGRRQRRSLPPEDEAKVLERCRRRCCVCFVLDGDASEKKGQLAHLDKDRSNNIIDNFVYLCFHHHDTYDSTTSQSKNLTEHEVRLHQAKLHQAVEQGEVPRRRYCVSLK